MVAKLAATVGEFFDGNGRRENNSSAQLFKGKFFKKYTLGKT